MQASAVMQEPAWAPALGEALKGERKWEKAVEALLEAYPSRQSAETKDACEAMERVIAQHWLSPEDKALFNQRGVRGLSAEQQQAKEKVCKRVRSRYHSLLNKWLYPDNAVSKVDGCFWMRNESGFGVTAVERVPQQVVQVAGKKRVVEACAGAGAKPKRNILEEIAEFGAQGPSDIWRIHDEQGERADGCGIWPQFRIAVAAAGSFGKTFLVRELLRYRCAQMSADSGIMPTAIVFSSSKSGWDDINKGDVRDYDPELIAEWFAETDRKAQFEKSFGRIPAPLFVIFDDVVGEAGVEKDKTIDALFTRGRHFNISTVLIGQSPKGLVSPIRKTNTTIYFFGNFSKEPEYNKPFAKMAGDVKEETYADWARSHFGKKNGYRFGAEFKEAVGDKDLPWVLATATEQERAPMPEEVEMETASKAGTDDSVLNFEEEEEANQNKVREDIAKPAGSAVSTKSKATALPKSKAAATSKCSCTCGPCGDCDAEL